MSDPVIMLVQHRGELEPGDRVLIRHPSGLQFMETVDDLTESGDVIWTIGHYLHERKMVLSTDPIEVWIYPKGIRGTAPTNEDQPRVDMTPETSA
ncbi:hypothetical protein ABH924_001696 [Arthrobacter sp. GAS37]